MAEELLSEHADRISAVVIVPSSGGRFVVKAGERLLYNKKDTGRFPSQGEVARALAGLA